MRELLPPILILIPFCAWAASVVWAVHDAGRRGKSRFLVFLIVFFFFPFGLIAWLLFRPTLPARTAVRW